MRKLLVVFVMLASMVFASCGNSAKGTDAQTDSLSVDSTVVVDSIDSLVVVDSLTVDSL